MDIITQRFIAIGNKLLAELRHIGSEIGPLRGNIKEQTDAINGQRDAERNADNPPPVPLTELQIKNAVEAGCVAASNKNKGREIFKIVVETGTLIGVGVYAYIAILQWSEMKRATTAATGTAKTAIQTMHLNERAWIAVYVEKAKMTDNAPLEMPVTIVNEGKTNALNVQGNIVVNVLPFTEEPDFVYRSGHPSYAFDAKVLPPKQPQPLNWAAAPKYLSPTAPWKVIVVNPKLRGQISRGVLYIVVHGRLSYEDIFGVPHWLQFCTHAQTGGPGVNAQSAGQECGKYYDVDRNF